MYEQLEESG